MHFSDDSQFLASGSEDKNVILWSRNGTLLKTFKGHNAGVSSVRFSPDGKTLASAGADNVVKLWQLSHIETQRLDGDDLSAHSCRWLHDYLQTNPSFTKANWYDANKASGDERMDLDRHLCDHVRP